ncbi:hypothetical protein [Rhodopseudomonas sp. BAL398]|uniref:hypothetical protein n=1 Tax=Rhodopseudomonas sp. BAL398 TaxID=3034676 RepID=UPI000AE37B54|nr:hypothetical protein [Rhodopseudomonas sp. BAL398]
MTPKVSVEITIKVGFKAGFGPFSLTMRPDCARSPHDPLALAAPIQALKGRRAQRPRQEMCSVS